MLYGYGLIGRNPSWWGGGMQCKRITKFTSANTLGCKNFKE